MKIQDFVTGIQYTKYMEMVSKISSGREKCTVLSLVLHFLFLNSNKIIWNAFIKIELLRKKKPLKYSNALCN